MTCIPDAVRVEIQSLLEAADIFLGGLKTMEYDEVTILSRFHNLARLGHTPFPGSVTEFAGLLGTLDTSSLL